MKTYIYTLEHPITNEIRYVGKTNNPERRLHYHWTEGYKQNNKTGNWLKSLKKKKLKPIMFIIDNINTDWEWLEKYWISQFKTWGFNLTNHTDGGEGVYGGGQWNNVPITVFTKEGLLVKSFKSQKECAKYFKISHAIITAAIKGRVILVLKKYQIKPGIITTDIEKAPSYKEYQWHNKPIKHWLSKPIKCIEDDKIFSSTTEAAKYYGVLTTTINNILNGKSKKTRTGKSFCRV
jgi:hypothetical protein